MNVSGLRAGQRSPSQQADHAPSSSTQASPAQTGRRLQRQDALPANNRYHASQTPATPDRARAAARYASGASSSAAPAAGPAGPSMALSRQHANRENPTFARFHDAMQQSPKMLRASPVPEKPEKIPERLQQKADAIDLPGLKKLDKSLYEYAKLATELVKEGAGPDNDLADMDRKLLPLLADAENARNPGLNLRTFKSSEECYRAIKDQNKSVQQSRQPMSMRVLYPPLKGARDHRVALDIQFRPGHRPSIVGFESAPGNLAELLQHELEHALRGAKVQVVENTIQNSLRGCSMFALNNGLKSFKHHDEYTARLHSGEKQVPVPAEFLKHAHSKALVEGHRHQDAIVSKDKGGLHAETLLHRNLAYRADRINHSYSTSIEGFRLQEIQRAGEFLAARKQRR
ncbi:YopJ family acetyltransferase [Erwinia pyrifoliae]|uniref:YopJ family acetyltransferase n=1 Tax=Erwinia pyrifoliae TaxID=79967 RepID=UPI0022041F19|nr:YopJ family acetyltransferase [Erwinia pyrifoliae]UWS29870.1 avirulence protein [Erwinia pyrifoliae]